MLHLLGKIPNECYIALSGGRDSMALLHFVTAVPNRKVHVLYFNHGTEHGRDAEHFVTQYCMDHKLNFTVGSLTREKQRGESSEMFWREQRYALFDECTRLPLLMAHHLDDCVETWLWTALHGQPRCIPYRRNNIIRPFLLNARSKIDDYVAHHNISYIDDPSNANQEYVRNYIRHTLVPNSLQIHPGLRKEVRKVVMKEYNTACKNEGLYLGE